MWVLTARTRRINGLGREMARAQSVSKTGNGRQNEGNCGRGCILERHEALRATPRLRLGWGTELVVLVMWTKDSTKGPETAGTGSMPSV